MTSHRIPLRNHSFVQQLLRWQSFRSTTYICHSTHQIPPVASQSTKKKICSALSAHLSTSVCLWSHWLLGPLLGHHTYPAVGPLLTAFFSHASSAHISLWLSVSYHLGLWPVHSGSLDQNKPPFPWTTDSISGCLYSVVSSVLTFCYFFFGLLIFSVCCSTAECRMWKRKDLSLSFCLQSLEECLLG